MIVKDRLFIGGDWVEPEGTEVIQVISPVTEEPVAEVPHGSPADIDRAVAAARSAFERGPWPRYGPAERADLLVALGRAIAARREEFARTITAQNGSLLSFNRDAQVPGTMAFLDYYAQLTREFAFEEERPGLFGNRAIVRREPVGVVGAIIAWNGPLLQAAIKLAPAIATGCTAVLKPAPEAPLDSYLLAECLQEAGLPDGVINIVAAGREVGEHLVTHPDVDKITLTGSTAAGRRIAALCGGDLRRVTLELGGKSAAIICPDVDLPTVIPRLVAASTRVSGQACASQTRILVPASVHDEVVDGLVEGSRTLRIGDPTDPATDIGPLVAERQRRRVEGYIALGRAEGARVAVGGGRPAHLGRGWYVEPTVFVDVKNSMRIAQEEIFGPVIAVIPYHDADEAVAIANDSSYGLSGSVWTGDRDRALDIARRVRTGTITVNGFTFEFNCPFGGYKNSGIGRELGPEGFDAFLEYKTITVQDDSAAIFGS
ncbi:MAG TPA: aldehyde dehydrogenase [Acidimicrobiia bacterium]|nr:aldehyde dehydrogenase [Acidimicrobiia bacterium]